MLNLGIIRPSSSPWASPLHMVHKASLWRLLHLERMYCSRSLSNTTHPWFLFSVTRCHHLFKTRPWHTMSPSSKSMVTSYIWLASLLITSRDMSDSEAHHCSLHMAQHRFRCLLLDTFLCAMPMCEDTMPHTISTVIFPCSRSLFPNSSYWTGWTAAIITRFFLLPILHWLFHQVARSHPTPLLILAQRQWYKHFSVDGYPGSAFPQLLLPTVAVNLNIIYGQIWCHFSGANGHAQQLTTCNQTERWIIFIDSWSVLWKHKTTQTCGWRPCHLFCSEFKLPSKRTFPLQQLNWLWHNSLLTWRIIHSYNYRIVSRSIQLYHTTKSPYATNPLITTTATH